MADDYRRLIREKIQKIVADEGQPGLIGKASGEIYFTPPGGTARRDKIWVRLGGSDGATEIIASCVANIPRQKDLPVIVANRNGVPTIIRIDQERADVYTGGRPVGILEHAYTHLPTGNDALLIVGRAFLPLMARPSNPLALTVTVGAGFYRYLATETAFSETTTSSFSSYLPAAGMQTFVILSLNRSTNALAITASGVNAVAADAVPFTAAQALTVVAGLADYHYPLCAIRLYGTQTVIRFTDIFMDLRLWGGEYVGTPVTDLDDLSDVAIVAPATGDTLIYNGSGWVNAPPSSTFATGITAPFVDYPLADNNGSSFPENTGAGTIPGGWTQVDSAAATYLNAPRSYWTLGGTSGDSAWEYKKQTAYDFEAVVASNAYKSYWIGPIIIKDGLYSADLDYYLALHADNAGAPDATKFVRLNIHWDSSGTKWQIRGQHKDGTTQTDGTFYDLARMPLTPFWLRLTLKNDTNKAVTVYTGAAPYQQTHTPLASGNASSSVTWGQAWFNFSMARSTGGADYILIGGFDYSADS